VLSYRRSKVSNTTTMIERKRPFPQRVFKNTQPILPPCAPPRIRNDYESTQKSRLLLDGDRILIQPQRHATPWPVLVDGPRSRHNDAGDAAWSELEKLVLAALAQSSLTPQTTSVEAVADGLASIDWPEYCHLESQTADRWSEEQGSEDEEISRASTSETICARPEGPRMLPTSPSKFETRVHFNRLTSCCLFREYGAEITGYPDVGISAFLATRPFPDARSCSEDSGHVCSGPIKVFVSSARKHSVSR